MCQLIKTGEPLVHTKMVFLVCTLPTDTHGVGCLCKHAQSSLCLRPLGCVSAWEGAGGVRGIIFALVTSDTRTNFHCACDDT